MNALQAGNSGLPKENAENYNQSGYFLRFPMKTILHAPPPSHHSDSPSRRRFSGLAL